MSSERPLGELRRCEHGVAAVRRDQRVRHGADAAAAPPRRLLVGRDADRRADHLPGDVGRVAVTRLHAMVVVARGHEDDRLAVRRLEHAHDVRRDQRAAREHAEVRRSRGARTACSRPRSSSPVSHGSMRSPSWSAWTVSSSQSYEQSLRIAIASSIPPSHALVLLEDLHHDARTAVVLQAASHARG